MLPPQLVPIHPSNPSLLVPVGGMARAAQAEWVDVGDVVRIFLLYQSPYMESTKKKYYKYFG